MSFGIRRSLAFSAAGLLILLPLALFHLKSGSMTFYLGDGFPPGQAAYAMMRPAGHLAFALVFLQIILGLHGKALARWLGLDSLLPFHKCLGLCTLGIALLHPVLFMWAQSMRLGEFAFSRTFLPNPTKGYWNLYFFFGALSLYGLMFAVLAALLGPRLLPRGWKILHALNYPAFILAWRHCLVTGNEVREQPLQTVYTGMMLIVAGLTARRLWDVTSSWRRRAR